MSTVDQPTVPAAHPIVITPTPGQLKYQRSRAASLNYSRAYYEAHKERRQQESLAHYHANRERIKAVNLARYHRKVAEYAAMKQELEQLKTPRAASEPASTSAPVDTNNVGEDAKSE